MINSLLFLGKCICYKDKEEDYYHEGVVDTWDFPCIEYNIQLISDNKSDESDEGDDNNNKSDDNNNKSDDNNNNKNGDDNNIIIILGIVIAVLIIVILIIVILMLRKRKYQNIKDNIENITKNKDGEDYRLVDN